MKTSRQLSTTNAACSLLIDGISKNAKQVQESSVEK